SSSSTSFVTSFSSSSSSSSSSFSSTTSSSFFSFSSSLFEELQPLMIIASANIAANNKLNFFTNLPPHAQSCNHISFNHMQYTMTMREKTYKTKWIVF